MTTLRTLILQGNQVSDLSPLAGLKLTDLLLLDNQITDLAPLKGMPLLRLHIYGTGISDLTHLQGMPLQEIRLTPQNITQGLEILRDMPSLKTIGTSGADFWPATEFWQRHDKGEFSAAAPFSDADVQRIAALPAEQQVEEVRKELMRRNFGGELEHKIKDSVATGTDGWARMFVAGIREDGKVLTAMMKATSSGDKVNRRSVLAAIDPTDKSLDILAEFERTPANCVHSPSGRLLASTIQESQTEVIVSDVRDRPSPREDDRPTVVIIGCP